MARRKTWRNWAEIVPAWTAFQILTYAPLGAARILAAGLSAVAFRLTPRWRRVGLQNLELALPEIPEGPRRKILRECYRNLGRNLLALARLPRLNERNIGEWINYEGLEHFERSIERGRGVIFLTAHLGCWELSSAAHALMSRPMHVMVRPLDNPLLDRLVDRRRTLFGNRTIRKRDAARSVLQALRRNEAVGILADQHAAGEEGVWVDFFRRPASATRGVAQLAARSGAAVIPGFAFWNEADGRYVLKFYPPIELASTGDREADIVENTQRFQNAIERAIREAPGQWLWIHRRWKRPPGDEGVEADKRGKGGENRTVY